MNRRFLSPHTNQPNSKTKKPIRSLVLILLLTAAVSLHAEEGWRDLFNGKDVTGWKANAYPESWSVVDGVLRTNATKASSHLFFTGDKTDGFERLRTSSWKSSPGANRTPTAASSSIPI